jgi:GWxTD domain-containing protein
MSRRGITLTLSLFLLSSVLPVGAQKNKVVPKTTDTDSKAKDKRKEAETNSTVLKGWVDDVSIIITDEERKAFKKLTKDEERENFTENFWLVRDPTPDTPENEFRDQYYERIDYANDHFTSGVQGMRTDRGKMYILNGPPDEIVSHPSGGTYYRPDEEGGGVTNTFPFETWRYRHLDNRSQADNVIYEFVDKSMSGEYSLEYDPGAKDALTHVPGVGLTAQEEALGLDKSDRYNKTNTLQAGASAPVPANYGQNNMFDMLQKYNEAYKPAEVKYNDIMVPAATRLSTNQLPFRVQANYVKLGTEEVRTLITIQLLNRDLAFQDEGGAKIAQAHVKGVIYRADNRRIPGFEQDIQVPFPTSKSFNDNFDLPNLYQETRYLLPGLYKLHLTIEDKHSQSIGVQDIPLRVPRIPDQTLQASSMILAYSVTDLPPRAVGTEQFALGDKKVRPNVTGVFRRDQNLSVWQEIYGLTIDQTTHKPSAAFELVISQNKQEIKKLESESTEVAGSGQQMKYTNTVPLADFAPGQYEVQIKVTDKLAKESFVTTNKFTVASVPAK